MQGLTLRNKPRSITHKDTFRAYLDVRPHWEPNCIWPFTPNLRHVKRQDANKETMSEYYLTSFSSVYDDEIVLKSYHRKFMNKDKFDANSASHVFGADVRGYLTENLNSGDDFSDVFSRTKTLENPSSARTKAKERREGVMKAREPRFLSSDVVDLILAKAQSVDPNQMEITDVNDKLSRQESENEVIEIPAMKPPKTMFKEKSEEAENAQHWYRNHVLK